MNIYEQLESIDFSAFLEFPPACPIRNRPTVKITDDVRMLLCGTLRKEALERQRDYCVRFRQDGRYLAIYPEREANMCFRANGSAACHEDVVEFLRSREIQFPAVYEMRWYERENAWVGCCKDLPEPDLAALRQSAKRTARRRVK